MNCKVCNNNLTSYWQKHFCSKSCAAKFNNKKFPKKIKSFSYCLKCKSKNKNKFYKFCDTCINVGWDKSWPEKPFLLRTLKEELNLNKNKGANRYNRIRGQLRYRKNLKDVNEACQNCGYSKHVEYCHKKPISSFSENTLIKEINSDSNIISLCPNCHWEYDNNLLKIE